LPGPQEYNRLLAAMRKGSKTSSVKKPAVKAKAAQRAK
jgi:hypothetical protein